MHNARGRGRRRAAATGIPDEHALYAHAPRVSRAHRQAVPGCHKAHRADARNAKECARRHGAGSRLHYGAEGAERISRQETKIGFSYGSRGDDVPGSPYKRKTRGGNFTQQHERRPGDYDRRGGHRPRGGGGRGGGGRGGGGRGGGRGKGGSGEGSGRFTEDGTPVNPNYKGDLADYKSDFRGGGSPKHKNLPPYRR